MERFKMTGQEIRWVLYDVGNSAFTLLVATILPIYFNSLADAAGIASDRYMAYWGYAASAATLIVAALGPVFGTLADTKGYKKPVFFVFPRNRCIGMHMSWLFQKLDALFNRICDRQGGIFRQSDRL